jgi:glutathione S-transferase
MASLSLVIGNKNYSSWSMRPWVLMTHFGITFNEIQTWLYQPDTEASIKRYSPTGLVPCLIDGPLQIWDTLAIAEYLAEKFPNENMWPVARDARAIARSVTAEMHSGFGALRRAMPMNIRNRYPGKGRGDEVDKDIARLEAMWNECRQRFGGGGDYLFGAFSIADAFYAPVVFRFNTYGVRPRGMAGTYMQAMLATPALQKLAREAAAEGHALPVYDDRYPA